MAIFGIGASYEGRHDVSGDFLTQRVACVGWGPEEAPALHAVLRHIKIGDIIYIKSNPANVGLIVKAVGIVVADGVKDYGDLRWGIPVDWVWEGEERMGKIADKYAPVRNITLYEEYGPEVQKTVLDLLLGAIKKKSRS